MSVKALLAGAAAAVLVSASGFASDLFDRITAGRYVAVLADCAACHTTPGGKPFAGGLPLDTPFGKLIPSNITPDLATGIGGWSYADFRGALKEGIGKGGKRLYPAMPYPAYSSMTEADIADLWAYFQKIEPVERRVVSNQLPFPFSIRSVMIGWNMLNFSPKTFVPDASKSPEWNRGAYIVNGPAHCGTCHTPKSLTGADKPDQFLRSGNLQSWVAPDISNDGHRGIGSWSSEDLVAYLRTGANRFDIASGPMAEVITNSTQSWTDADLTAVAAYLKDVKGSGTAAPAPLAASDPMMVAGKAVFLDRCSACHVSSGEGQPSLFPKLAKAPVVNGDDPTSLIRVVLEGSQAVGTAARPTTPAMPSFGWNLGDAEVASVLSYVRNSWGNAAPAVTPAQVRDIRAKLAR